jgi:acyl-CoA thioesterase-2
VILSLSSSFAVDRSEAEDAALEDHQAMPAPDDAAPLRGERAPFLVDCEFAPAPQVRPSYGSPTRFWLRCAAALPAGRCTDAAVVAYLSDLSSGHFAVPGSGEMLQTSLDHSMWFHRRAPYDGWVLLDFQPHSISRGRGLYTGTLWRPGGVLVASLAQETLYRSVAPAPVPPATMT